MVILSPIFKSKLKLSSLPIEILFFSIFELPTNLSFLITSKLEKSLSRYPLKITPFELSVFTIIASLELLRIKFFEIKPNLFFIFSSIKIFSP